MTKIENSVITSTMLGREDHGILTAFIQISGHGWGVGFGGYSFDQWDETQKRRIGADYGMEFIAQVLETLGVTRWEKLPGTHLRVEIDGNSALKIGHIIEDKWFDPKALAESMKSTAVSR